MNNETKEIIAIKAKKNRSRNRLIASVHQKYSAIQLMTSNKNITSESEQHEALKDQATKSDDLLLSLDVDNDPLKAMLATQMAAIHDLQQKEFLFASQIISPEKKQYHINAVTKLSNVFIQQASLMQKLQGKGQQKVTVEHVHVHNGGQAIVGNVESNRREG
jgi:hypothetical protein